MSISEDRIEKSWSVRPLERRRTDRQTQTDGQRILIKRLLRRSFNNWKVIFHQKWIKVSLYLTTQKGIQFLKLYVYLLKLFVMLLWRELKRNFLYVSSKTLSLFITNQLFLLRGKWKKHFSLLNSFVKSLYIFSCNI
jgi:hypothetical protein